MPTFSSGGEVLQASHHQKHHFPVNKSQVCTFVLLPHSSVLSTGLLAEVEEGNASMKFHLFGQLAGPAHTLWEIKERLQIMMEIFSELCVKGEDPEEAQSMLVQINIHEDVCCLLSTGKQIVRLPIQFSLSI